MKQIGPNVLPFCTGPNSTFTGYKSPHNSNFARVGCATTFYTHNAVYLIKTFDWRPERSPVYIPHEFLVFQLPLSKLCTSYGAFMLIASEARELF